MHRLCRFGAVDIFKAGAGPRAVIVARRNKAPIQARRLIGIVEVSNGQCILHAIARAIAEAGQEAITALTGIEPLLNFRTGNGEMRCNAEHGGNVAGLFGACFAFSRPIAIGQATLFDDFAGAPTHGQIFRRRRRAIRCQRFAVNIQRATE